VRLPRRFLAATVLLLVASTGPASAVPTTGSHARATTAPIVVIVMENHSFGEIVGKRQAQYINNRFIPAGKLFTNYWAITHPSLPNYLAMTSGTTSGCRTDTCHTNNLKTDNVFHQLATSGGSWAAYQQSMPSECIQHDSGRYVIRHNPPPYYRNLMLSACRHHDVPYPSPLPSTLSDFTFVTPNACNDMHDCGVRTGDRWLRDHVPAFIAADAIVVITFDEGSSSNRIMTAAVGPGITAGTRTHTKYTHYGLLAAIEMHFGLRRLHQAGTLRPLPL